MTDWTAWNEVVAAANRFVTPNKNARPSSVTKPTHIVVHITGSNSFDAVHNGFMNSADGRSAHYLIKKDGTIVQYAKDSERAWHAGIKGYVQSLYDEGTLSWKKYMRYFSWYTGYPADAKYLKADLTPAANVAERALVARADDSDWPAYGYWSARHGTRIQPVNYDVSKDPNSYSIGIELLSLGSTNAAAYEEGLYEGLHVLLADLCDKYDIPVDRDHVVGHEDVNPVERWGWDPNSGFEWDKALDFASKKYSLPVNLGFSTDVKLETVKKYLEHIENGEGGGYYPIGGNTVWHGGVHIKPSQDSEVLAVLPGKVIAARLPEDASQANKHYGSRNFILLEHSYKEKKLFSLYMHLKPLPLAADNAVIKKIKWISRGDVKTTLDALKTGDVVKLDLDVRAGEVLWVSGEYGSATSRAKMLHWEIFSETNIFEAAPTPSTTLEGGTGWAGLALADQALRVKAVRANQEEAFEGDTVVFTVTKCNYKDAPSTEKNKINWRVSTPDGAYSRVFNARGLELELQVPGEVRGKTIKAQPYVSSPSDSVVATVAISSLTKIDWLVVEDADSNYNVDCASITGLFPADMWSDRNLTLAELIKFYRTNPNGNATKLRFAICKFIAEWGIPDLDAAVKALKNRGFWMPGNPKGNIEPYLFWQRARDKGVALPASPHVWHYHPVILLGLVASLDVATIDGPTVATR